MLNVISIPIIVHFGYVLSQTLSNLIKFIEEMQQHLHQISYICFLMKYDLMQHFFELADVNIYLQNLVEVRDVCVRTKPK